MKNEISFYITRPELWEPLSVKYVMQCACGQLLVDTMNKGPKGVFTVNVNNMFCPECGADHARLLDVVSASIEAFAKLQACLAQLN